MNVLVACEESQAVTIAFRKRGHIAFSCDIQECSGGFPEWHIKGDVLPLLNGNCVFMTQDTHTHTIAGQWDLIIAHPPCTYLTVTGNRWFNEDIYGEYAKKRKEARAEAARFFMKFVNAKCDRIAIENPVGYMGTYYRSADQVIQPYYFGDPYEKLTCLWLKNLPLLKPTDIVEPKERQRFRSGKSLPAWYAEAWKLPKEERAKIRSKTFPGIAEAMAAQWGILTPIQLTLF